MTKILPWTFSATWLLISLGRNSDQSFHPAALAFLGLLLLGLGGCPPLPTLRIVSQSLLFLAVLAWYAAAADTEVALPVSGSREVVFRPAAAILLLASLVVVPIVVRASPDVLAFASWKGLLGLGILLGIWQVIIWSVLVAFYPIPLIGPSWNLVVKFLEVMLLFVLAIGLVGSLRGTRAAMLLAGAASVVFALIGWASWVG